MAKVVLAGGNGFIGQALADHLAAAGYDVVILTRTPTPGRHRQVGWDARTLGPWATELDGAASLVNLVGKSVNCRKTPAARRKILASRVDSVAALAAGCRQCRRPPPVWLQTGTAHIFGDTDDQILDERSPIGAGFAPEVGTAWERALADADTGAAVRKVNFRISFVLGRGGGALATLARIARLGLGGTVGTGRQWMSWIHLDDVCRLFADAIADARYEGTYVATAPAPVQNREFMAELRRAVRRPWSPPAPAPMVRLGSWLMRTDPELALLGRRCMPTRLTAQGFAFRWPALAPALADLL